MDYGFDGRGNVLSQFARWQEELEAQVNRIQRGLDVVTEWEAAQGRKATAREAATIMASHVGRGNPQPPDWGFIIGQIGLDVDVQPIPPVVGANIDVKA